MRCFARRTAACGVGGKGVRRGERRGGYPCCNPPKNIFLQEFHSNCGESHERWACPGSAVLTGLTRAGSFNGEVGTLTRIGPFGGDVGASDSSGGLILSKRFELVVDCPALR